MSPRVDEGDAVLVCRGHRVDVAGSDRNILLTTVGGDIRVSGEWAGLGDNGMSPLDCINGPISEVSMIETNVWDDVSRSAGDVLHSDCG